MIDHAWEEAKYGFSAIEWTIRAQRERLHQIKEEGSGEGEEFTWAAKKLEKVINALHRVVDDTEAWRSEGVKPKQEAPAIPSEGARGDTHMRIGLYCGACRTVDLRNKYRLGVPAETYECPRCSHVAVLAVEVYTPESYCEEGGELPSEEFDKLQQEGELSTCLRVIRELEQRLDSHDNSRTHETDTLRRLDKEVHHLRAQVIRETIGRLDKVEALAKRTAGFTDGFTDEIIANRIAARFEELKHRLDKVEALAKRADEEEFAHSFADGTVDRVHAVEVLAKKIDERLDEQLDGLQQRTAMFDQDMARHKNQLEWMEVQITAMHNWQQRHEGYQAQNVKRQNELSNEIDLERTKGSAQGVVGLEDTVRKHERQIRDLVALNDSPGIEQRITRMEGFLSSTTRFMIQTEE